ncbi:hypothetical protein BKA62DRAFT_715249 [Auriculariales sp. MPI-PUGE-AT-0066]|nr:hypothetical protein BKA62DRAFT_715249 [Auriculariales sp. MPI-PUGE-AT-0066]
MSSKALPSEEEEWNVVIRSSTSNYSYDDSSVSLRVGGTTFRVSRQRLSTASPQFAAMFSIAPANGQNETIVLNHDVDDFTHFLWFLHLDPVTFLTYREKCLEKEQMSRAISIAVIAHFYEASSITKWAIGQVRDMAKKFGDDISLMTRVLRLSPCVKDIDPDFDQTVRNQCLNQIEISGNPVAWLAAGKEVDDQVLQGRAYYWILYKSNGEIAGDSRLNTIDRLRLLIGSQNLRRYEAPNKLLIFRGVDGTQEPRVKLVQNTTDPRLWSPQVHTGMDQPYDGSTLWEMFTVSPLGLVVPDHVLTVDELAVASFPGTD